MPSAWATAVVAVLSSGVGGVVGAFLHTRHERTERRRDRMLTAADDLATGLMQGILSLRHSLNDLEDSLTLGMRPTGEGDLREARRLIDEASARVARIELLFGLESPTAIAASASVVALRRTASILSSLDPDPTRTLDYAGDSFGEASAHYRTFSEAAREAIRSLGVIRG